MLAFADGHTAFINEAVNYTVYARLMTSNGKKYQPAGVKSTASPVPQFIEMQSAPVASDAF